MNKLIKKFKKSEKVVQENQKKFKHEMDLRNEKHKLRESDLMFERERMKQLAQAKKEQIISKEQRDANIIKLRYELLHNSTRALKQDIMREQLMNNRINELIKKGI